MKTKFDFECRELEIDDGDFGFTIIFSENLSSDDRFKSENEILNYQYHYLLIQLT